MQWKSNKYYKFWVYVCSLRYPACNAHAPYCHLWPARLFNIFPRYFTIGTIFEIKKLNITRVFYLYIYRLKHLPYWRNGRGLIKNTYRSSFKVPVNLVRFEWNLNFLDIFSKNAQILNFMKIRLMGAESFHAIRRTDRHDEANSRCSQFCENA
jgi:hypothetical protein